MTIVIKEIVVRMHTSEQSNNKKKTLNQQYNLEKLKFPEKKNIEKNKNER